MVQQKLVLLMVLILSVSFVAVFADTGGDLSIILEKSYKIHYEAINSQIQSVQALKESQSLVFSVTVTSNTASLQLTLPRELIDATKIDGTDDDLIVLVDGTFAAKTELNSSPLSRTILIPLTSDNKEVEIIGTRLGQTDQIPKNNESTTSIPINQTSPNEQGLLDNSTNKQIHTDRPTGSQSIPTNSQTKSEQDNMSQRMESFFYKSEYLSFDLNKKQVVEYSIIAAIVLVFILVIASSIRFTQKNSRII